MGENKQKERSQREDDILKHAVVVLYMLAYSQTQHCNWFQRDLANFVHCHGLRNNGMRALHEVGLSVGINTYYREIHDSSSHHIPRINRVNEQQSSHSSYQ